MSILECRLPIVDLRALAVALFSAPLCSLFVSVVKIAGEESITEAQRFHKDTE
jgi:hypothetical protein